METKLNCWEVKLCGRQPGGNKVHELGICPAATDVKNDGLNSGKNGGRVCWSLTGTFCGGKVQGTYAQKQGTCLTCEFMQIVRAEEGASFKAFRKYN